jgi:hypothetical protein
VALEEAGDAISSTRTPCREQAASGMRWAFVFQSRKLAPS